MPIGSMMASSWLHLIFRVVLFSGRSGRGRGGRGVGTGTSFLRRASDRGARGRLGRRPRPRPPAAPSRAATAAPSATGYPGGGAFSGRFLAVRGAARTDRRAARGIRSGHGAVRRWRAADVPEVIDGYADEDAREREGRDLRPLAEDGRRQQAGPDEVDGRDDRIAGRPERARQVGPAPAEDVDGARP